MSYCQEMFACALIALALVTLASSDAGVKGSCPPTLSVDICDALCGSALPCVNRTQICCATDCGGSMCVDPVTQRHFVDVALVALTSSDAGVKGSCPPTLSVDICDALCGSALPCVNRTQICCATDCGGSMCVDPVTQRHFVDVVKPGLCPASPRGVWVCSHMCTSDSDCPRALKCCPNRCGASVCQKPESE